MILWDIFLTPQEHGESKTEKYLTMNYSQINNHLVSVEIVRRSLPIKTAISETANAFGLSKEDVSKMALINTGFDSFDNLETVYHGRLLKGDLVLNRNPANCEGQAFRVVPMDGNLMVEQCYLVLRRKG